AASDSPPERPSCVTAPSTLETKLTRRTGASASRLRTISSSVRPLAGSGQSLSIEAESVAAEPVTSLTPCCARSTPVHASQEFLQPFARQLPSQAHRASG